MPTVSVSIPKTLLHYTILQPLGRGGMGELYLAEDRKLGRRVALKVLQRGREDDAERQRFEREARAVAALNHPNIVTIHAVEHDGNTTFLTMEIRVNSEFPTPNSQGDRLARAG